MASEDSGRANSQSDEWEVYILGTALEPLRILHAEGWGPDGVRVNEDGVSFYFDVDTGVSRSDVE